MLDDVRDWSSSIDDSVEKIREENFSETCLYINYISLVIFHFFLFFFFFFYIIKDSFNSIRKDLFVYFFYSRDGST